MISRVLTRALWVALLPLMLVLQGCGAASTPEGFGVGSTAPAFSLPDALSGRSVSLSDFSGRPVLLYFHMAVG